MTVDLERSLINYIWTLLTADTTLKALMGGIVRLYLDWATPDAVFPYLVHRLDIRKNEGTHVVQRATYYLDIWSHNPSANEAYSIRERVVQLLDELIFNTDDVTRVHIEFSTSGSVPEVEQDIWHRATMWELIFRRKSEATAIEGR